MPSLQVAILQVAVRGSRGLCTAIWREPGGVETVTRMQSPQSEKVVDAEYIDAENIAVRSKLLGITNFAGWKTLEDGGSVGMLDNICENATPVPSSQFSDCWNMRP